MATVRKTQGPKHSRLVLRDAEIFDVRSHISELCRQLEAGIRRNTAEAIRSAFVRRGLEAVGALLQGTGIGQVQPRGPDHPVLRPDASTTRPATIPGPSSRSASRQASKRTSPIDGKWYSSRAISPGMTS